jgi:hypothetical protein
MRRLKSTQGKHDEFLDLRELGLLYRLRPTNKSTKQSYRNHVNLTITLPEVIVKFKVCKADEEIAPKYTFFRKYFEIGDEEIKIHKK